MALLLLLLFFVSGVDGARSVCPQPATNATPATEANSHGLITCVMSPYPRPKSRRGRLPPPTLSRRRFTARRLQAWQQHQELHLTVECALWRPVSASQLESPTL